MDEELKKRGIEYLLSQKEKNKQEHEFSVRELAVIIGISESSVYSHMETLVKSGKWGTRRAFDPESHKTVKVWWLIE